MRTIKLKGLTIGIGSEKGGGVSSVQNFNVEFDSPDGIDKVIAHITFTPSKYETEVFRSIDGAAFALRTTLAPNIGLFDNIVYSSIAGEGDYLYDGDEHTIEYYLRFKQDLTVLNAPDNLTSEIITGGVRITGNVNNTDAQWIKVEANIDNAGYNVIATIPVSGATFTTDHTISGNHSVKYRVRAMEGTLPIYSDYGSEITQVIQIVDQDGNVYTEIVIGTQTWLVENFKSTKYKDGSTIAKLVDANARKADTTGAMEYPNNDINNKSTYGCLYNWYAIKNSSGFGINGYQVPTQAQWNTLIAYLGTATVAGKHMKESGTTYWETTGGDNSVGFKHRGAGKVDGTTGNFVNFKNQGVLYTNETTQASVRVYASLDLTQGGDANKAAQLSVRLIKI